MGQAYKIGAFAALTGVSIRTLHHYDRLGVLKPSARSEAGYRLYAEGDLLRLQQVLTLRYLGFTLAEIGETLDCSDFDLETSLRIQRDVVHQRISSLEQVDAALDALLDHYHTAQTWDWTLVARASSAARDGIAQSEEKMEDYYSKEELNERVSAVAPVVGADEIQAVEGAWPPLLAAIRANDDLDPASPEARALLDQWDTLLERTMRGFAHDPKIAATIAHNYDRNAYAEIEGAPKPDDVAFLKRVREARDA